MQVTRQMLVLPPLETLCQQAGVRILDYIRRSVRRPTFAQTACLEPLPQSQGILQLLRHLQSDHRSALRQDELGDNASHLVLTVARLFAQVQCFRLLVGPLSQNADLVCQLFEQKAAVA
jgi:hypothetical protein